MASDLVLHGRLQRGDLDLRVELSIGSGVTALIGPNGVGKTSVLRIIAGLDALSSGELRLGEQVLDRPADNRFVAPEDRDVAYAFQEPRLFPHLSVLDNIAYPRRREGRSGTDARADARRVATALALDDLVELRPRDLSGGQAQRVNVARALAADASTLLLDEPLASIDDHSRDDLRRRLRESGSTRVVWVTHDPSDLSHADRVISLPDVVRTDAR